MNSGLLTNLPLIGTIMGTLLAGAFTYYDLRHNRNIPTPLIYTGFVISFIYMVLFPFNISSHSNLEVHILLLTLFMIGGIVLSKTGAIGEADIWLFGSLWNFVPFCTIFKINMPSIIPLIGFSAISSIIILFPIFMLKLYKYKPKISYKSILTFSIYLFLAFLIFPFANMVVIGLIILLGLISALFSAYEGNFKDITVEYVKISEISNGDVVELGRYPKKQISGIPLPKVLDDNTLKLLKHKGVKELWIYSKLPPYTPFILIGFVAMMLTYLVGM